MSIAKKKVIILLGILITLCTLILLIVQPFSANYINERDFKKSIASLTSDTKEIDLDDLVPFEWDCAYAFSAYTSVESMEEVIGFKSNKLSMNPSEGMTHIMFVYDNEVVCNIGGYPGVYPGEVRFRFNFSGQCELKREDNPKFSVKNQNGIKNFKLKDYSHEEKKN